MEQRTHIVTQPQDFVLFLHTHACGIEVIAGQARFSEALAKATDAVHTGGAGEFLDANAIDAVPSGFAGLVETFAEATDAVHTGGASAFLNANAVETVPTGFAGLVETFAKAADAVHTGGTCIFFDAETRRAAMPTGFTGLGTALSKKLVVSGGTCSRGGFGCGREQQQASEQNRCAKHIGQKGLHGDSSFVESSICERTHALRLCDGCLRVLFIGVTQLKMICRKINPL